MNNVTLTACNFRITFESMRVLEAVYGETPATLADSLVEQGFLPILDDALNIVDLEVHSYWVDDAAGVFFDVLAPYVEVGSYIELILGTGLGDDGAIWRWSFDGKNCHEIYPTITWEAVGEK